MIMNSQGSSTVTTVGDVQENQISIDQKNLEHIITILSSNLYSHPEQSFLREIVSNAIDAQVEAKSEEPAIISIVYDSSSLSYVIAIRDYGVGISPERFKEIYLNIGSSTKRESNDYIGSFGIGRFSALACADMVHITSYYEGTQYNYLMLKNGPKINVDLLSTEPTEEHNGVEVKIKVSHSWPYINALCSLWFVPNVYVHGDGYDHDSRRKINDFNNRKLCRYKNFVYNNTGEETLFVLLGNILYPVDSKYIPAEYGSSDDLRYIWQNIIPQFNIGDLDITPNREQLLYSDKTIKALEEKFKAAAEELIELCGEISKRTFTNLFEYYNEVTSSYITITLPNYPDEDLRLTLVNGKCFLRKYIQYNYKNDPIADDEEVRKAIGNLRYKTITNVFSNAVVFTEGKYLTLRMLWKNRWECKGLLNFDTDLRIFFVPTMEGTKSDIFKSYLKEKADAIEAKGKRAVFILTTDQPSVRKLMKNSSFIIKSGIDTDIHKTLWLLRELKNMMNGHLFVYDVAHSKAFLNYRKEVLEQRKEERKNNITNFSQTIRFYVDGCAKESYYSFNNQKIDVNNVPHLLDRMNYFYRQLKKPILPVYWGIVGDPYLDIWEKMIRTKQVFLVVTVAKTNVKYLEKEELPKNWQRVDADFILNSREFRKWMTCYDKQVVTSLTSLEIMRKTQDRVVYPDAEQIRQYSRSNLDKIINPAALEQLKSKFKGYYDQTMLEGYELFRKYNEIAKEMRGILALEDGDVTPLSMYVAMKRKIVRPRWEEYQRVTRAFNSKTEETDEENS